MLEVIKINDNITLNYIPVEKLKTTSISMYIHRELKQEEASENAILPHILKHGSKLCKNSEEIAHYLENLYGAKFSAGIAKRGDDHILCFDFETISDKYAPNGEHLTKATAELMMSLIFNPLDSFNEEVFLMERTNSIMKIKNIINDKRVYANYRCCQEMSKGDKYEIPRMGYLEDMEKLEAKELYSYFKKLSVSSKIDIYVCGDTNISEVEDVIKTSVSGISFESAKMPESSILRPISEVKTITDHLNVTQGKLSMGFVTDISAKSKEYLALVVANAIFGGGAQSKLFNNVREKLSLAYYAGSFIDKYKGYMMVNAGIEFDNFQKAYDEIMVQFEEMKSGNISDDEFNTSKGFILSSLSSYYDDQHALISYYLNEKIAGTDIDIESYRQGIEAVTKEDVISAFSKIKLAVVYFLAGGEAQ